MKIARKERQPRGGIMSSIGDAVYGTLLGPSCSFNLDRTFNGELVAGGANGITLMSGAVVNQQSFTTVPEPASFALLGLGLLGLAARLRRKK